MKPKTILVIEDELPLLDLLKQMLEQAGYQVLGAKDGLEAREIYRQREKEIDLVLSDMALPKIGGWSVYLMLREINSQVKVIFTSGYLDPKVKTDLVKGGALDFIPKPYVAETILNSVSRALELKT